VTSDRLAQSAGYLCALELAEIQHGAHEEARTDLCFFGKASAYRKNLLKQARRMAFA
jgi:hypothetical protein